MTIDFRSDNTLGCSPEIVAALERASHGSLSPYGNDEITAHVRRRCRDLFETEVEIFPVLTGTSGNALSIASMTPSWGAVFCHEDAHIHRDELGAPEFYTTGAKLIPLEGANGKISAPDLAHAIKDVGESRRMAVPSCVSLTQATESGTIYSLEELRAVTEVAHRNGLGVQMDGARFANAVVTAGCSAADMSWRAGVDVLVFGGTKNGAAAAELIVVFRKDLAGQLALRFHRSGHRLSKMRFLSAQFEAYLTDDLWLRNARHANAAAARVKEGLSGIGGVEILRPVEANILVVRFPRAISEALQKRGFLFYDWLLFGEGAFRIVTGFSTTDEDVDALIAAAGDAAR